MDCLLGNRFRLLLGSWLGGLCADGRRRMTGEDKAKQAAPARVAVSKKLRFDVFKRDGFACQYCGAHPPDVILECDHIMPVVEGGQSTLDNLVTACFACNRGKGKRSLLVVPQSLTDKAAEIAEREEQLQGYREILWAQQSRIEEDMWQVATTLFPKSDEKGLARAWLRSIRMFNERLGLDEALDAADIALGQGPVYNDKRLFAYFCGVCWRKVRARQ